MDTGGNSCLVRGLLRCWLGLALAAVAALTIFGAACGGDEDREATPADVEAAIQAAIEAWNGQDVKGWLAAFTDRELEREFDATREELEDSPADFIGEPPITLGEFSGTRLSGGLASTTVTLFLGKIGTPERFKLVKEDGAWLIDSRDSVVGDVPDGVTVVDLALTEYAFDFDASAIIGGNFVFNMSNEGEEDHQLVLMRAPLQPEEGPEGLEDIGIAGPIRPGKETTVLFSEELEPGRYIMLCFVEDAEGTRHASLGMVNEFVIE